MRDDSPDLIQLSDASNTYSTQLQDRSESTDNETSITLRANGVSSGKKYSSKKLFFRLSNIFSQILKLISPWTVSVDRILLDFANFLCYASEAKICLGPFKTVKFQLETNFKLVLLCNLRWKKGS